MNSERRAGQRRSGLRREADRLRRWRVQGSGTRGVCEPAAPHCDEDRSCQWIHGAGISSQNLRKPTEATADPQLLELNPKKKCRANEPRGREWREGRGVRGCNVRNEGKV